MWILVKKDIHQCNCVFYSGWHWVAGGSKNIWEFEHTDLRSFTIKHRPIPSHLLVTRLLRSDVHVLAVWNVEHEGRACANGWGVRLQMWQMMLRHRHQHRPCSRWHSRGRLASHCYTWLFARIHQLPRSFLDWSLIYVLQAGPRILADIPRLGHTSHTFF